MTKTKRRGQGGECSHAQGLKRGAIPFCPQIFTRMGQCYTFNSGAHGAELLTIPKGGAGNGLEIMLDVQQEEYLPIWKDMGEGHRVICL